MKTLNPALILAKNQKYLAHPWIWLLEIDIDDTTTRYLAIYPQDVTWNGQLWTRFPATLEPVGEDVSGKIQGLALSVANVSREISSYLEQDLLLGREVTLYVVNRGHLDVTTDVLTFTYRINKVSTIVVAASFELGHDDLFAIQIPRQRFVRDRCRFFYRDEHCAYLGDEFGEVTEQDFFQQGDGEGLYGWYATNMAGAALCDTNDSPRRDPGEQGSGQFVVYCKDTEGALDWNNSARDGPYVYKLIDGDFDCYIKAPMYGYADESGPIFMVQSDGTPDNWLGYMGLDYDHIITRNTIDASSSDAELIEPYSEGHSYWRIARVGNVFRFYSRNWYSDLEWAAEGEVTNDNMEGSVRVGIGSWYSGGYQALAVQCNFWFIRFTAGGFLTCDYSYAGPNGCQNHKNTIHNGGCPALPNGRLL